MSETIALSPTLCTTSWSEEWKRLQAARNAADDPWRWDARSAVVRREAPALRLTPRASSS